MTHGPYRTHRSLRRAAERKVIISARLTDAEFATDDEWRLQHRYVQIEVMTELDTPAAEAQSLIPSTKAA